MAVKTVPARTETYCDVCGILCQGSFGKRARKMAGQLIVKRHVLDYLGVPAADGTVVMDLCDSCLVRISEVINSEGVKIKEEAQQ